MKMLLKCIGSYLERRRLLQKQYGTLSKCLLNGLYDTENVPALTDAMLRIHRQLGAEVFIAFCELLTIVFFYLLARRRK